MKQIKKQPTKNDIGKVLERIAVALEKIASDRHSTKGVRQIGTLEDILQMLAPSAHVYEVVKLWLSGKTLEEIAADRGVSYAAVASKLRCFRWELRRKAQDAGGEWKDAFLELDTKWNARIAAGERIPRCR